MMYVILGLGLFFIGMAFVLTEKNAKYLLAGYNTMTEKERRKFDISGYVPYFRKFHIFLGISLALIGMPVAYIYGDDAGGIFLTAYTLLGYTFFIVTSRKFSRKRSK
jgi:hypothetical protein